MLQIFYTVLKAIWYKFYPLCLEYVIVFNEWNVGEALWLRTGHIKEFKCSTPIYIFLIVGLVHYSEDDTSFVKIVLPFIMRIWVITLLWFPLISLFLSRSQVFLYSLMCYIVTSWYFVASFDIKLNVFAFKRNRQPHSIFQFRKVFVFLELIL